MKTSGACANNLLTLSGGLRFAATTGYFLAAFQAAQILLKRGLLTHSYL